MQKTKDRWKRVVVTWDTWLFTWVTWISWFMRVRWVLCIMSHMSQASAWVMWPDKPWVMSRVKWVTSVIGHETCGMSQVSQWVMNHVNYVSYDTREVSHESWVLKAIGHKTRKMSRASQATHKSHALGQTTWATWARESWVSHVSQASHVSQVTHKSHAPRQTTWAMWAHESRVSHVSQVVFMSHMPWAWPKLLFLCFLKNILSVKLYFLVLPDLRLHSINLSCPSLLVSVKCWLVYISSSFPSPASHNQLVATTTGLPCWS